jgi:hypothetical protein
MASPFTGLLDSSCFTIWGDGNLTPMRQPEWTVSFCLVAPRLLVPF